MPMLPSEFAELEPFAAEWCLATERERWAQRMSSSMDELQAFYDAMLPRVPEAIAYCDQFALDDMPDDAVQPAADGLLVRDRVVRRRAVAPDLRPRHPRHRLRPDQRAAALTDAGTVTTQAENELMTRVEGDAPMGRLMRENYWIPFAMSSHLVHGDGADCPCGSSVRTTSPSGPRTAGSASSTSCAPTAAPRSLLARDEGNGVRCIYHGWKIDASGCVVECPTQAVRPEQFAASVRGRPLPGPRGRRPGLGVARRGPRRPPFPDLPFADEDLHRYWCTSQVPVQLAPGPRGHDRLGPRRACCTRPGSPRPPTWPSTPTSPSPSPSRRPTRPRPPPTACGRRRCARRPTVRPTCGSPST